MRIAGYIEDKDMKITIFQYHGRFSVKFENPLFEQTYKLNESLFPDLDSIHTLVSEDFKAQVRARFENMSVQMANCLKKSIKETESIDDWPEII